MFIVVWSTFYIIISVFNNLSFLKDCKMSKLDFSEWNKPLKKEDSELFNPEVARRKQQERELQSMHNPDEPVPTSLNGDRKRVWRQENAMLLKIDFLEGTCEKDTKKGREKEAYCTSPG